MGKGTLYLFLKGRGDFSRPDFGRLKPPLPQTIVPKSSSIAFAKLNNNDKSSFGLEAVVDIGDQVEEIVHESVSALEIDLVDEEVASMVFVIHPFRDNNNHLLNLPAQDHQVQG